MPIENVFYLKSV